MKVTVIEITEVAVTAVVAVRIRAKMTLIVTIKVKAEGTHQIIKKDFVGSVIKTLVRSIMDSVQVVTVQYSTVQYN